MLLFFGEEGKKSTGWFESGGTFPSKTDLVPAQILDKRGGECSPEGVVCHRGTEAV